jgi:uncharacterized protein with HEPN domain
LRYIATSIALIRQRTARGAYAFLADVDAQDAVLWRLQTLAEASARLSDTIKNRHPEVPWRAIWGFRNVAAHAYLDLKLDDVWEIISRHLAQLDAIAQDELALDESDGDATG